MTNLIINHKKILSLPGINVQEGLERAAGNINLYFDLLDLFVKNHKDFAATIQNEIEKNNRDAAERMSHSLKGVSGSLGANELFNHLTSLENELKKEDYSKSVCKDMLSTITPLFEQIIQAIIKSKNSRIDKKNVPTIGDDKAFTSVKSNLLNALKINDANVMEIFKEYKLFSQANNQPMILSKLQTALESYSYEQAIKILNKTNL